MRQHPSEDTPDCVKAAGHDVALLIGRVVSGEINWRDMRVAERESLARQTVKAAFEAYPVQA